MTSDTTFTIVCGQCNASLKVKKELAGRQRKCPKCGTEFVIPEPPHEFFTSRPPASPATERQKEYAISLGVEFAPDISRHEISALIDKAVKERDGERVDTLQKLDQREGELWEEMRQRVIAEMDAEDLPLSKASMDQMIEALDDRGLASILITIPWDNVIDFENLAGVSVGLSFTDMMQQEDMEAVIMQLAANTMNRRDS